MPAPSNEELLKQIRALGVEVHALRAEVERLKAAPHAATESAFTADDEIEAHAEPAVELKVPDAVRVPEPAAVGASTATPAILPPAPAIPPSVPAPKPALGLPPYARRPASSSWKLDEKFVGEKLMQYAGMFILTLGIIFFLIWTAAHAGPAVRVLLAFGAGAALIAAGLKAETKPPYDQMTGVLIGGGWTTAFVTAYAAGHWTPTKVVDSPEAALTLLLATAAGMVGHAVSLGKRPLRLYAVALTYFVMLFCGQEAGFDLFLILFAASAVVAVVSGEADILPVSLAGYYLNYIPVYFRTITAAPNERTFQNFLSPFAWIAGAYAIVAVLPLIPKARRLFQEKQAQIGEAALCLSSALFAVVAGSMGRVYFGVPHLPRAAGLAAAFAVPSLLYTRILGRRSTAAGLNALLALGLLAAAVFEMPDPMWKLLAWILVSCGWVWVGLFFGQPVWRASGLAMSMLTFAFYWNVASAGAESRREASMALFLFTGLAYFFSRFYRVHLEEPEPWEEPSRTLWLHAGSLALVLGLWGVLDAAPFLCALCALAVAAEFGAQELRRADLWTQAVLVEFGLGAYSFFVDYGANAAIGGLSPRLLTTAIVLSTYAYLYFADVVDDALASEWKAWSKAQLREGLTWLAFAVASFAVYREFDGRLRLPVWALMSLGLYRLGRARGASHFKTQGVLLAAVAAWEAGFTYLYYPSALLSPLDAYKSVFFWGSCAALLGGLFMAKDKTGGGGAVDAQAAAAFGALPLVLGACYFAKELDSVQLTLAWTGLGLGFLVGGLALDWRELRHPALGLLALCVGKALLSDTANMPLPYRVASFVALGLVLLFGSSLYVRAGSKNEENPPADPG